MKSKIKKINFKKLKKGKSKRFDKEKNRLFYITHVLLYLSLFFIFIALFNQQQNVSLSQNTPQNTPYVSSNLLKSRLPKPDANSLITGFVMYSVQSEPVLIFLWIDLILIIVVALLILIALRYKQKLKEFESTKHILRNPVIEQIKRNKRQMRKGQTHADVIAKTLRQSKRLTLHEISSGLECSLDEAESIARLLAKSGKAEFKLGLKTGILKSKAKEESEI